MEIHLQHLPHVNTSPISNQEKKKEIVSVFLESKGALFFSRASWSCAVGGVWNGRDGGKIVAGRKEKKEERQRDGFKGRKEKDGGFWPRLRPAQPNHVQPRM